MSDNISNEQGIQNDDAINKLLARGLDVIASSSSASNMLIKQDIITICPDILLDKLDSLDPNVQGSLLQNIVSQNPALFLESEQWWSYIVKTIDRLTRQTDDQFAQSSGLYVLLNRVRDLRESVDWNFVFEKLSNTTISTGYKCQGFSTVINWLINVDKENLRKVLHNTASKSYPSSLKTELYSRAIDLGIFDAKIARRVRSDSSGTLSSDILAYLFEHRHIYSDEAFQDLVTQFSDTKHKWVARYIAINMPMHLVPFLMGINDELALKILEQRMEVLDDSR